MWFVLLIIIGAAVAQQSCTNPFGLPVPNCCACGSNAQSTCTNPCTQFCGCQCSNGLTGFIGGSSTTCLGRTIVDACGVNGIPGSSAYSTTNQGCVCAERCGFTARTTLCSGHGVLPNDYMKTEFGLTNLGFPSGHPGFAEMDCFPGLGVQCVGSISSSYTQVWGSGAVGFCLCDPGYFGQTISTLTAGSFSAKQIINCNRQISVDVCSSQGRDITGPPDGAETCTAGRPFTSPGGSNGPLHTDFTLCGKRYISSSGTTASLGVTCLCNAGIIGGATPPATGQCASTIRATTCSGHGQDQCSTCRYPSSATLSPSCQCDLGWGPGLLSGQVQCNSFVACATYGCGTPFSAVAGYTPTLGGTCSSPSATSCTCKAGYSGLTCCPLQFGNSTTLCNGKGTCTTNGYCSCNAGFQAPGCCPTCDASQTCLVDGRCDCPVLGSVKCGAFGTGCSNTTVKVCTFRNATVQPRTGIFFNVSISGTFGCPPCAGGVCTSTSAVLDTTASSVTGSCRCLQNLPLPYNRTGSFCCPTAPGQHAPCSGGVNGYCNPVTGNCVCDPGVLGQACETNTNCNPSVTSTECGGNGQCVQNTAGQFGLGDYLSQLNYTVCTGSYTTREGVSISDCGLVLFLKAAYDAFFQLDPTQVASPATEASFYPITTACPNGTRSQCLFNLLVAIQEVPVGTPLTNTLCAQMQADSSYVSHAFERVNPTRTLFQGSYATQLASMFSCSSSKTVLAEAMASVMAWELWNVLYRNDPLVAPDTTSFSVNPALPTTNSGTEWQCSCPAGIGGTQCQLTGCPVGTNGLTCSGFTNGIFHGHCTASGQCECSAAFGCAACDCPKTPGCFPDGGSGQSLCTGGNGECVLNNITRSFQCQCQSQFTGDYCELSKCQPPGKISVYICIKEVWDLDVDLSEMFVCNTNTVVVKRTLFFGLTFVSQERVRIPTSATTRERVLRVSSVTAHRLSLRRRSTPSAAPMSLICPSATPANTMPQLSVERSRQGSVGRSAAATASASGATRTTTRPVNASQGRPASTVKSRHVRPSATATRTATPMKGLAAVRLGGEHLQQDAKQATGRVSAAPICADMAPLLLGLETRASVTRGGRRLVQGLVRWSSARQRSTQHKG